MPFQILPIIIVIALAGTAFAQSGAPVISSSGYSAPVPLTVAPGQLVTLFVPSFGGLVSASMKAPAGPLPNTLAGVSAVFRHRTNPHRLSRFSRSSPARHLILRQIRAVPSSQ